eukprot:g47183.t1
MSDSDENTQEDDRVIIDWHDRYKNQNETKVNRDKIATENRLQLLQTKRDSLDNEIGELEYRLNAINERLEMAEQQPPAATDPEMEALAEGVQAVNVNVPRELVGTGWGYKSDPKTAELYVVAYTDGSYALFRKCANIQPISNNHEMVIKIAYKAEFNAGVE